MDEILLWIREHAVAHYNVIKNLPGFPGECFLSSQLLGSYLQEQFPDVSIEIVFGTFGIHQLFHAWLLVGEDVVDLTTFQFIAYKEKKSVYQKATGKEILDYALSYQEDIILSPTHPLRDRYHALVHVEPEFTQFAKHHSYDVFLQAILNSQRIEKMSWCDSVVSGDTSFASWMKQADFRLTRRFFTKWAIVPVQRRDIE